MPAQNEFEKGKGPDAMHPDYSYNLNRWQRARDVMAGEDQIKLKGETYLPRLDGMTDTDYKLYKGRANFFNATGRTMDGLVGMIFRASPVYAAKENKGIEQLKQDSNLRGFTLDGYTKDIVEEIMETGRVGTLVDWNEAEDRTYLVKYQAEQITNWRVDRINGKMQLSLVVLHEEVPDTGEQEAGDANIVDTTEQATSATTKLEDGPTMGEFDFVPDMIEQYRVLKLVIAPDKAGKGVVPKYQVELWRRSGEQDKIKWSLFQTITPTRRNIGLTAIPFVFHGAKNALPDVDKIPLDDVIHVNLHHYRIGADYNHGLHFTALPTAYVCGFPEKTELRIGSSTAWVTDNAQAKAGYLEFHGQGLTEFNKAFERDERLMAVLGARLLEEKTRAAETAQALEIRASGEGATLMNIAIAGGRSMTDVLRWVTWWNGTEADMQDVAFDSVEVKLNTDFTSSRLTADDLIALVKSWQGRAISQDTLLHNLRQGEILPPGVSIEDEKTKIETETPPPQTALPTLPPNDPENKPPAGGGNN